MTLCSSLPQSNPFLPAVLDGVVLPKAPEEILAEKNFNTVPYIVGINKQEFGWLMPTVSEHKQTPSTDAPPPTRCHASTLYFLLILYLSFALYLGSCFHCYCLFMQGNSLWHGSTEMPRLENSIPIISCLFSMNSKILGVDGSLLA